LDEIVWMLNQELGQHGDIAGGIYPFMCAQWPARVEKDFTFERNDGDEKRPYFISEEPDHDEQMALQFERRKGEWNYDTTDEESE
jgi:hypothetical protein